MALSVKSVQNKKKTLSYIWSKTIVLSSLCAKRGNNNDQILKENIWKYLRLLV